MISPMTDYCIIQNRIADILSKADEAYLSEHAREIAFKK